LTYNLFIYSIVHHSLIGQGDGKMETYTLIVNSLIGLVTFFGMLVFGVSLGWLLLDSYKKNNKAWQTQVMFLAGFFALLMVMVLRAHEGLAGFSIGFAGALLLWGLPRKPKTED
jgi:hypothetical protein